MQYSSSSSNSGNRVSSSSKYPSAATAAASDMEHNAESVHVWEVSDQLLVLALHLLLQSRSFVFDGERAACSATMQICRMCSNEDQSSSKKAQAGSNRVWPGRQAHRQTQCWFYEQPMQQRMVH
jgi:hypothetical protein